MAKVLVRAPDVTGAAGHGNAPAKGAAGRVKGPAKSSGDFGTPVTITCDQKPGYALSIKKSSIVLAQIDPSDPKQKWDKDDSWGDGFAIVNTDTNQAIQRPPDGAGHRLLLVKYDSANRDDSVMWKQNNSKSSPIREHDDTTLVFDSTKRGDDTVVIVAKESNDATSQKWTIVNK
ncbi:ricin B-like lectin R40G3 [Panicum virgatum]|uniref:Uncharacterized protein n=1 Tax=Panicum virgatum TaxID=38727 RepID=A0A8T0PXA2_PANVG|nr:ricin B-like lectin R40G3 [Panicum virgatum]KAG2565538.1 hypothetical protein PVAP13_7NG000200 [Panicum virgatum]